MGRARSNDAGIGLLNIRWIPFPSLPFPWNRRTPKPKQRSEEKRREEEDEASAAASSEIGVDGTLVQDLHGEGWAKVVDIDHSGDAHSSWRETHRSLSFSRAMMVEDYYPPLWFPKYSQPPGSAYSISIEDMRMAIDALSHTETGQLKNFNLFDHLFRKLQTTWVVRIQCFCWICIVRAYKLRSRCLLLVLISFNYFCLIW